MLRSPLRGPPTVCLTQRKSRPPIASDARPTARGSRTRGSHASAARGHAPQWWSAAPSTHARSRRSARATSSSCSTGSASTTAARPARGRARRHASRAHAIRSGRAGRSCCTRSASRVVVHGPAVPARPSRAHLAPGQGMTPDRGARLRLRPGGGKNVAHDPHCRRSHASGSPRSMAFATHSGSTKRST